MAQISALLFLPPPPDPPSLHAVEAAFRPPLLSMLRKVAEIASLTSTAATATVDIALPFPNLSLLDFQQTSSSTLKTAVETVYQLLFNVYFLISSIYDEEINNHACNSSATLIEVRVILLHFNQKHDSSKLLTSVQRYTPSCLIDLPLLALCDRSWTHVFVVDGEPGERLYSQFMAVVNSRFSSRIGGTWETKRVSGGLAIHLPQHMEAPKQPRSLSIPESTGGRRIVVMIQESGPLTFDQKLQLTIALFLAEFGGIEIKTTMSLTVAGVLNRSTLPDNSQAHIDKALYSEIIAFLLAILSFNTKSDLTTSHFANHLQVDSKGRLIVLPFLVCLAEVSHLEDLIKDGIPSTVVVNAKDKLLVESMDTRGLDIIVVPVPD